MKNTIILFLCISLFPLASMARIYKWTDENGKVHFGDSIPVKYKKDSEKVDVRVNVVSTPKVKKKPESSSYLYPSGDMYLKPPAYKPFKNSGKKRPARKRASSSCASQWAAYKRSKRCYSRCSINVNRGGMPSGQNIAGCKCRNVVMPSCDRS